MSSASPILAAEAVDKGYRSGPARIEVLRGLDFEAREGEIVAVVGASGVGKSTLLHVLGGIDPPDKGRILHRGQALPSDEQGLASFRNRRVGFVFQFHYLLPEFTAAENVAMPLIMRGGGLASHRQRALALLAELGLGDRAEHRPGELSGGEQQRVAIARALAPSPEIVLADEPTGNLDVATGGHVFEAFTERVRERGVTTVMVTHNEDLAARCTRVVRLVGGGVVAA